MISDREVASIQRTVSIADQTFRRSDGLVAQLMGERSAVARAFQELSRSDGLVAQLMDERSAVARAFQELSRSDGIVAQLMDERSAVADWEAVASPLDLSGRTQHGDRSTAKTLLAVYVLLLLTLVAAKASLEHPEAESAIEFSGSGASIFALAVWLIGRSSR